MNDKDIPEARRLANLLEQSAGASSLYRDKAAAELRRLYADNEKKSEAIQRLWKERDELRVQRDELLVALKTCVCAMQDYQAGIGITEMFDAGERMGRAAIAKAEKKT